MNNTDKYYEEMMRKWRGSQRKRGYATMDAIFCQLCLLGSALVIFAVLLYK